MEARRGREKERVESTNGRGPDEALVTLAARVTALEARHDELARRAELVAAAARQWRPVFAARGQLVVTSDAGDVAHVPIVLVGSVRGGRSLDVEVRDAGREHVEIVDRGGKVLSVLPRALIVALPRIAASPEVERLLGHMAASGLASRSCSSSQPATGGPSGRDRGASGPCGQIPASRMGRPSAREVAQPRGEVAQPRGEVAPACDEATT